MNRLFPSILTVLLGFAFVFPVTPTWAGIIVVNTPNGGEKWTAGKSRKITWSTSGVADTNVKIQLLKSGKHYKWVSKKTKNDPKELTEKSLEELEAYSNVCARHLRDKDVKQNTGRSKTWWLNEFKKSNDDYLRKSKEDER